jgi:protein-S-isoprenylcysteine O-methyltransferase Ste14
MRALKVLIWGTVTVLLIVFLFQNGEVLLHEMDLKLALPGVTFRSAPIPLYALILGALFLGVLGAALYCGLGTLRFRQTLRSLQRENESLQEELRSFRPTSTEPPGGAPETRSWREPGT